MPCFFILRHEIEENYLHGGPSGLEWMTNSSAGKNSSGNRVLVSDYVIVNCDMDLHWLVRGGESAVEE